VITRHRGKKLNTPLGGICYDKWVMSIEDVRRAERAVREELERREGLAQGASGENERQGLVNIKGEERTETTSINTGLVFTSNPEQNASAYPGEPETPGANPLHTGRGLKKMEGKETYVKFA
jgi:hypothetical protein